MRPSYTDLLDVISRDQEDSFETGSRYTIVMAAAKRAREIVDHAPILVEDGDPDKPVSTAVKELYASKIKIGYAEDGEIELEEPDMDYEAYSVVSDDMFRKDENADEASGEDSDNLEEDEISDGEDGDIEE